MSAAEPYILFELANAWYGVRSAEVEHIAMLEQVTPVPNTAPAVEGVVFSRGKVVPALNLRTRFGLPAAPHTSRTRLVFLKLPQRVVALIVDAAREFRTLPADTIKPVEETLHGIDGNYVKGVATVQGRLVLLLDIPAVLARDDLAVTAPGALPVGS